jgi:rhodanese-related sulfurtransferase
MDNAPNMLLIRWSANLSRDSGNAPLISPAFLADQGPGVQIADIRAPEEATGVLGYIPGSSFPGIARLEQLARDGDDTSPLVLVCATGEASAIAARKLEELGMTHVAALAGGLAAWRSIGLSTSRDAAGVRDTLYEQTNAAPNSGPLTLEDVRKHTGDPRSVRWMNLSSMIAHGRLSCIDGRDERGVVGSPGGDGGEFLLMLSAYEIVTGNELDEEMITRALLSRLDTLGQFYMHTDLHAFEALTDALKTDSRLQTAVTGLESVEDWADFLRTARRELWETLLEHIVDPANIGCGHIRLMLQHSDEYGIRGDLVVSFLRVIYRLWWQGAAEVGLTILPGGHEECAIVNVRMADGIWGLSRVPLISPAYGGQQMFINHPDVSAFLRRRTVQYFIRGASPLSLAASQEDKMQQAVDELADRQLGVTVGYLAKGLPIFDVVFESDGSFDVRSAG